MINKRWYDSDPILKEALELLRLQPDETKSEATEFLLKLQEQVASEVIDHVYEIINTYQGKGNRWYDNDPMMLKGVELLRNAPANRLYYIYSGTFDQLPNLTYVDLYNLKIKEICGDKFSGKNAFYDCKNLQSVYINGNFLKFISSAAFGKCNKVTLYICVESKDLKKMENKIKRMSGYPFGLRPEQIKITTY